MATQENLWVIYQIQRLDGNLAAIERRRAALDDGTALGREVAARRQRIASLEEEQRQAGLAVRDAELELSSVEARIQRLDQVLYSGKVGNPKELQGYQDELASLRRRKDTLEEQVLTRMEESDAATDRLAAAREAEADATARWKAHVLAYRTEVAALDAATPALVEQREAVRAQAEADLLRAYDAAARLRKPLVGRVEEDACGACGMALPGRMVKEYTTNPDAELTCPTCGAHLLWRVPPGEA